MRLTTERLYERWRRPPHVRHCNRGTGIRVWTRRPPELRGGTAEAVPYDTFRTTTRSCTRRTTAIRELACRRVGRRSFAAAPLKRCPTTRLSHDDTIVHTPYVGHGFSRAARLRRARFRRLTTGAVAASRATHRALNDFPRQVGVQMHREVVDRRLAGGSEIFRPRSVLGIEDRRDVSDGDGRFAADFDDAVAG